jgi:hypothetical protein
LPQPLRDTGLSILFGSDSSLRRAFAYAKQVAAFAAGVTQPNDSSPPVSPTDPMACRSTVQTPHGVAQKRQLIHPSHETVFRQGFASPPAHSWEFRHTIGIIQSIPMGFTFITTPGDLVLNDLSQ